VGAIDRVAADAMSATGIRQMSAAAMPSNGGRHRRVVLDT
jgi:hypothetical protein